MLRRISMSIYCSSYLAPGLLLYFLQYDSTTYITAYIAMRYFLILILWQVLFSLTIRGHITHTFIVAAAVIGYLCYNVFTRKGAVLNFNKKTVIILGAVLAALSFAQSEVSIPHWIHVVLGIVIVFFAALGIKSNIVEPKAPVESQFRGIPSDPIPTTPDQGDINE